MDRVIRSTGRLVHRTTERMVYSRANYWLVLGIDVVGACLFLWIAARIYTGPLAAALALAIAGVMTWGILEYVLHRWVFHGPPSMAQRGHAQHHADASAHVATPMLIIMGLAFGVWGVLSVAVPAGAAAVFVFGVYAGYNWYAIVHHLHHHEEAALEQIPFFRRLTRSHNRHHLHGCANFGISTSLWDHVFGTYRE